MPTTTAATEPKISSDLAYTISEFLSEDDKHSLAAFSLVCRDWRDAGQSRLYRKLDVSNEARFDQLTGALSTMSLRTRSMPRELHLGYYRYTWDRVNWEISCARVIHLMENLPGVHTLTLNGLKLDTTIDSDALYTPRYLKTLRLVGIWTSSDPPRSPSVRYLIFFLGLFHGIQHLHININEPDVSDLDPAEVVLSQQSPPTIIPLRHLDLHTDSESSCAEILRSLRGAGIANYLRKLEISPSCPLGALQDILRDKPSVLQYLRIMLSQSSGTSRVHYTTRTIAHI